MAPAHLLDILRAAKKVATSGPARGLQTILGHSSYTLSALLERSIDLEGNPEIAKPRNSNNIGITSCLILPFYCYRPFSITVIFRLVVRVRTFDGMRMSNSEYRRIFTIINFSGELVTTTVWVRSPT